MKTKAPCSIDDLIISSRFPIKHYYISAILPELYIFPACECAEHEGLKYAWGAIRRNLISVISTVS